MMVDKKVLNIIQLKETQAITYETAYQQSFAIDILNSSTFSRK